MHPCQTSHFGKSDQRAITRVDAHCHSMASSGPAVKALGYIGCPESYSHPEAVYEQAKARGMDLVTLTDHDTIDGALLLHERGYKDVIIGEEVTTFFPEDRCKLHVLVWCLTPQLHHEIGALGLRNDVYQFAAWLHEKNLPHALAHPLYVQNRRMSPWHLERCTLLFKGFETLNGAHSGTHRGALETYLSSLSAGKVHRMISEHNLPAVWNRAWEKATTGGSDDHGLLNVGRTWTGVGLRDARDAGIAASCLSREGKITCGREFFKLVMQGRASVGGEAGHSALLAHQLTTVGAQYFARVLAPRATPTGRYVASKFLRFAGAEVREPSKLSLALHMAKRTVLRRRNRLDPLLMALRSTYADVMREYPDLAMRLDKAMWADGTPMSQHDRMAAFSDDLYAAMHRVMAGGAIRSVKDKDARAILDHVASYLVLEATQLPTLFSLFHQNKERRLVEKIEHDHADAGGEVDPGADGAAHASVRGTGTRSSEVRARGGGRSVLDRPMRVMLFTDTLGDVNGVSRFIRNAAEQALATGRDLRVVTSTNFAIPRQENIINVPPVLATKMPKYENLELVLPPLTKMLRLADQVQPDVIHISTPGSVGLVGLIAAKMLRCPVVGVYHTDFPAYIDKLFKDDSLTECCKGFMKLFYKQFASIFTRSTEYAGSLETMGIARERIEALRPGIMIEQFHPRFRAAQPQVVFERAGASGGAGCVRVLYCGRVSVEKGLPMLTRVWAKADGQLRRMGVEAELCVIGDGPYRKEMERELRGSRCSFLGFRHGQELSALYASADLFAFPSTTDTLGQVVMESQASGLPVLVTDAGGPKEVVRDGETGFVIASSDERGWVDRIVDLASNHEKRRRMGRAAHESMQGMSMARSFEHYWQVHERVWVEHLGRHGITPRTPAQEARGVVDAELEGLPGHRQAGANRLVASAQRSGLREHIAQRLGDGAPASTALRVSDK